MKVQRLCLTFARDEAQKHISHLDLMRMWERLLRRAGLPLAYSQGFSPRPRFALAAPLPVGVTSECELLEISLEERWPLPRVQQAIVAQLPEGFRLLAVDEMALGAPSLQSQLRAVTYLVETPTDRPPSALEAAVEALLARESLPWQHQRGEEVRRYDLRPLIFEIRVLRVENGRAEFLLRLRADEQGAGRPEQVLLALGLTAPPQRIHRVRLDLARQSLALAAYRAAGRRDD